MVGAERHLVKRSALKPLRGVIHDFSEQPPGDDQVAGAFYTSLDGLMQPRLSSGNRQVRRLFREVLAVRADMPPSHAANLSLRAIQSLILQENPSYPEGYETPNAWQQEIVSTLRTRGQEYRDLLSTRDTATTQPNRYLSLKTVLSALYPNQDLSVADFGCGGNLGLPALVLQSQGLEVPGITFSVESDRTPGQIVSNAINKPIKIVDWISVDKQDPYEEANAQWRLACLRPAELRQIEQIKLMEARLESVGKANFLPGDILELEHNHRDGTLPLHHYTGVFMSSMLYQLTPEERAIVIGSALLSTTKDGVVVIQDYAKKNPDKPKELIFEQTWSKPYIYRTFIIGERTGGEMKEVLRWDDGRCNNVLEGEDFQSMVALAAA